MKIEKSETKIIGNWVLTGKKMIADGQCERIQWLTANYLKKITFDKTGWDFLFQDPNDNRYWELIYLNSEMHGGGPPSLILLSEAEAKNKYHI